MFTCVFRRPKAQLLVLFGLLCALTALTLLTGLPSSSAQAADLSVSGNPGRWGQDDTGVPGASGAPKNVTETGAAYGSVTVSGGDGGKGGGGDIPRRGGKGGKGGNASLTLSGNDVSVDVLAIQGGNGGADGWGNSPGSGGQGGNAEVRAQNLSVNTRFSMSSGVRGDHDGGEAIFAAGTLAAKSIALTQNDGSSLFFNLGKLVWIGDGAFDVTQNSGGASITIGSLTIDGGTVNSNNYDNLIAPTVFPYTNSDITLGDNGATFNISGGPQTVGRKLIGTGGLTKEGTGTLELTGTNSYTGGTTINAGTLKGEIAANTALSIALGAKYDGAGKARSLSALNGEGNVFNTNGLIVQSGTFGGVIDNSNTGGLIKAGTGTLTLTGNNSYTGGTTISAGTLALSGNGSLGASSLLDLRGGGLDISGITPAALSLPNLDVHGPARLSIGTKTADFSGKTLSFYVPSTMSAGGALLSVSGAGTTRIGNSTVRVGIEGASSPLGAGDAITLIDATDGRLDGDPANTASKGEGMQGVTLRYAFDLAKNGNRLTATVAANPRADSGAKALSEGWLSGVAVALMGADLAAGPGLDNARLAAAHTGGNAIGPYGLAAFGAFSGGVSRYNTGSHVDVSGVSALAGLSKRFDAAPGSFLAGAFFEYGYGRSSTHNGFDDRPSVDGSGHSSYYGGGLLARFDLAASPLAGLYAEASFRFGSLSTDWHSDDLRDALGRRADYDGAVPYYGAHAGLGYVRDLSEQSSLDVYGKYFWTRVEGDSTRLPTGDPVDFQATDSQRLRLGARLATALSERVAPYLGAAWEHEFDGKARATTYGLDVPAPSLEGDSGVFELGVSFKPQADSAFSLDLAAQGYVGMRQGVSGSLQLKYEF